MPDSIRLSIPFVLAAVVAFLPRAAAVRCGVAGAALVTLATAAASRVGEGTPSFRLINGILLWSGALLFLAAVALAVRMRAPVPTVQEPRVADPEPTGFWKVLRQWGMPLLLALLLLPSAWFILTVAGSDAWSLQGLRDAPFSEAGETLLTALLLPATLVLAGVWPFGLIARGPRFAPLAALLLAGVVVPMAGDGLLHWRSLYAGWLVLAAFVSAARPNWARLLACAGLFAIACGDASVLPAGLVLTGIASLLALRPSMGGWLLRVVYFCAGASGIAALRATLGQEVVYSVLLLLAVLIAVLRMPAEP